MNFASLELSKRLYELSGWKSDWMYWKRLMDDYDKAKVLRYGAVTTRDGAKICFAYDLGFLLRKLPSEIQDLDGNPYRLRGGKNQYYFFEYQARKDSDVLWNSISPLGKEPEDAAAKLCIALFEQNILTPESKEGSGI